MNWSSMIRFSTFLVMPWLLYLTLVILQWGRLKQLQLLSPPSGTTETFQAQEEKMQSGLELAAEALGNRLKVQGKMGAKSFSFPFLDRGFWIISLKGKPFVKEGKALDKSWLSGWDKHFLLGAYRGGKIFENKAGYFLSRPTLYEEFLASEGKLTRFKDRARQMAYFFSRSDKYQLLYVTEIKNSPEQLSDSRQS